MTKFDFPTSQDIYIEINGKKLAIVENYKAKSTQENKLIEAFGENEPVGIVPQKVKHKIELSRVYAFSEYGGDNINFYDLHNFNLVIIKPNKKIIYSGCEWSYINENAALNAILENVEIIAAKRMEIVLWKEELSQVC